ncbi:glycosyltransferase family 4 protein [Chlorogloea sp. CCALA 695]|uniref:glycosyltransferase family 4 protein n=1 Tax=Chlorogloea sp. CCALA 695 TaxID=2107693 RepID=UPI000D059959|nr:glycosyltransferase family 4 protein [Chlorogloea sp. CCALA 695]PSB31247.1 glycosyl transferase family 1 [Chlorogloea sp. CCALA 695]
MQVIQTHNEPKRLRVLISAYACRPDKGSEPGVGWNMARELVKRYEVWVITRTENQAAIEAELAIRPVPGLNFVFYDLPLWLRWWKQGERGVHLHYYLWQIGIYSLAQALYQEKNFDLVHHVTYGRYCVPSFLALLPIPFIWGPLGGGESAPKAFWQDFSLRGKIYESLRDLSCWVGERDPFVRLTAKRSAVAIVATSETSARLSKLGVKRIETIFGQTGINQQELSQLKQFSQSPLNTPIRFVSTGRLLHWKGFHLGLRAFAQANLEQSEYWIIGNGPERRHLESLANDLGIAERVRFWGQLPREEALSALGQCCALVHPSLHDFSPTICLEAMAAGRPVICLDLGGPATQVSQDAGLRIPAYTPDQAVQGLAEAMTHLAQNADMRERMGKAGQKRISEIYSWEVKGQFLVNLYEDILNLDKVKVST